MQVHTTVGSGGGETNSCRLTGLIRYMHSRTNAHPPPPKSQSLLSAVRVDCVLVTIITLLDTLDNSSELCSNIIFTKHSNNYAHLRIVFVIILHLHLTKLPGQLSLFRLSILRTLVFDPD